ncbi:MAG: immunoglobulin-like domain-containing protein, partial [Bacteroidota bacterium]
APGIELKGDELVILPTGGSFTDPGAIGIDSLSGNKQTALGPVKPANVNVAGLYPLTYRAKDANGFTSEVVRNVFVFDNTLTEGYTLVTNEDLSGTYKHSNAPGRIVNVVKALPGLYICDDLYGTFTPTPLYFLHTVDGLVVPEQPTYTGLGDIQGTGMVTKPSGKHILNFAGLERIGIGLRARKLTQQ